MGSSQKRPTGQIAPVISPTPIPAPEPPEERELCFALEDVTDYGRSAESGWPVVAVPHNSTVVLIQRNAKNLGKVPEKYALIIRKLDYGFAYVGAVSNVNAQTSLVEVVLQRMAVS